MEEAVESGGGNEIDSNVLTGTVCGGRVLSVSTILHIS